MQREEYGLDPRSIQYTVFSVCRDFELK